MDILEKYGKYLPNTTYLYYVDQRDTLDDQADLLQSVVSRNSLSPISEQCDEWFCESDSIRAYLDEIRQSMINDGLSEEEYNEHEDWFKDYLYSRDSSTPVADLLNNTKSQVMFYSLGKWVDSGWYSAPFVPDARRALPPIVKSIVQKLGISKDDEYTIGKIQELCDNALDGGDLRIYFRVYVETLISGGEDKRFWEGSDKKDWKTIEFDGDFVVAVYNPTVGSGDFQTIRLNHLKLNFNRDNLILSKSEDYNIQRCFGCYDDSFDAGYAPEFHYMGFKTNHRVKVSETTKRERKLRENWLKTGKCSCEDPNMDRHKNIVYINEIPCRWQCTSCGREWYD